MNDTTPAPAQAPHPGTGPPAINSAELLAGTREVLRRSVPSRIASSADARASPTSFPSPSAR